MRDEKKLVVAIPKGRVLEQLIPRLERAGLDTKALRSSGRELIRDSGPHRFLLLKPDDVPTYVEYGAADVGIVGRDVLIEREYDLYIPLDLGIGRCQMMVCGVPGTVLRPDNTRPLRVATKFMNVAQQYFRAQGIAVELIYVQGSVEIAALTGLADVIVDLVETGETLRQNGLVPLRPIVEISSVLVANRVGFKMKRALIASLVDALRGASGT